MTVALMLAPCAITHGAKANEVLAGGGQSILDYAIHDHDAGKMGKTGHNHDHGDHDCLLNCQAWYSNSSAAAFGPAILADASDDPTPAPSLGLSEGLAPLAEFAGDGRPPDIGARFLRQLSIIDETARRRI